MTNEVAFYILIALVFAAGFVSAIVVNIVFFAKDRNKPDPTEGIREDLPTPDEFDRLFRIVQLHNGLFRIEEYNTDGEYWNSYPTELGQFQFNTLKDAVARKAVLVQHKKEKAGYRAKRLVQ